MKAQEETKIKDIRVDTIKYSDSTLISVFRKIFELLNKGMSVEISGIRQDVNRPINWAFDTIAAFKTFSDNFWEKYDEDSVTFSGVINFREGISFNPKKRSRYGTGVHYEFDIVEVTGKYSYIPSSKNCFLKCCYWILEKEGISFDKDLLFSAYRDFLIEQSNRKGVMTLARISKFNEMLSNSPLPYMSKKYNFIYVDDNRHFRPDKTKDKQNYALYLKDTHFCVVSTATNQLGIQEINKRYKEVKTVINESNLTTALYSPNIETTDLNHNLNNIVVFDLECYKDDKWKFHPYACGYFFLSNLMICYSKPEFTDEEITKFKDKVKISVGNKCIESMFKYLGNFIGDITTVSIKDKKKIVSNSFTVIAHNASGFDNYFVTALESLAPCRILKTTKGIIYLKVKNPFYNVEKKRSRGGETQYLIFKCSMNFVGASLKRICNDFKLPAGLCKTELDHQDITEQNWLEKRSEWEPYLKLDVLSLSFFLARYIAGTVEFTGFGVKDCVSAPGQSWKAWFKYKSVKEPFQIKTFTDKYTRDFVRKCCYGGRVGAFINKFESSFSNQIFEILETELHCSHLPRHKTMERYFALQANKEDKELYDKICSKLRQFGDMDDVLMAFDGTSLYPSAMAMEGYKYPDLEKCTAFTPSMEDELINKFNSGTFQYTGLFHCIYFNPLDLEFQHIPVKEDASGAIATVNRLRNGFIEAHLCSVDMEEIVKIGGKIIRLFEGIIFESHYEVSPLKNYVEYLFELRMRYKKEGNKVMETLVKLMLNALYGKCIQKDISKEIHIWSEETLRGKFDERVIDYSRLPCGKYIVELKEEEGVDIEEEQKALNPSYLGVFILSYSKRIMNNFVRAIDGFNKPIINYTDTDSLYIHKKYWNKLSEAKVVGSSLGQGKNDYETGGIFYGLFLGSKIKYCLTIDDKGVIKEHKTLKGMTNDCLSFDDYEKMLSGVNVKHNCPVRWKRSFEEGVIYRDKIEKEISAACNVNKRVAADENGIMSPYHNISEDLFEVYREIMLKYYGNEVTDNYEEFLNKYPNVIS
jgi:hypothetical protein